LYLLSLYPPSFRKIETFNNTCSGNFQVQIENQYITTLPSKKPFAAFMNADQRQGCFLSGEVVIRLVV
jgi:hypothetical protein